MNQTTNLDFLLKRRSCGRLVEPAPNEQQLEMLIRCASRAADHANLVPWRFIVLEGDDRKVLAEAMLASAVGENPELEAFKREKISLKPYRAPMVIVAVSNNLEHPKVPVWEQQMATAAAVQNLLNAAYIMELGAYWRTGSAAFSEIVKQGLKIDEKASIVGFIYLGTPHSVLPAIKSTDDWQQLVKYGVN